MTERKRDDAPLWTPPPEFLRELPDLIAGKDPELLKPEARAWMLRDPKARELAQEICGAIAMFADVPTRLATTSPEPVSLRAKRSVERAVKQLPQRLAEVLWPLLSLELDRLASSRRGAIYAPESLSRNNDAPPTSARDIALHCDALLAQLAKQKHTKLSADVAKGLSMSWNGPSKVGNSARRYLSAISALVPTAPSLDLMRLLVSTLERTPPAPDRWHSLIDRTSGSKLGWMVRGCAATALSRAGSIAASQQLVEDALRLADAVRSSAAPNLAYAGWMNSILIGRIDDASRYLDCFAGNLDRFTDQRLVWQRQFLEDADVWRRALRFAPRLVLRAFRALGGGN